MTIDEAIAHAREEAKEIRENIIDGNNLEPYESYCNAMTGRCAEEHEQIAEWLEELKADKSLAPMELGSENQKNDRTIEYNKGFDYGFKTGYNKAIDDFSNEIDKYIERYDGTIYDEEYYTNVKSDFEDLKKIGNQLKAGV